MDKNMPMSWYIGTEWAMPRKGLRKQVLSLDNFKDFDKPHLVSVVVVKVEDVQNLNEHESRYLANERIGQEQKIDLGMAVTPVDCYVDILVRQMVVGEQARCFITTRKGEINFILTLLNIVEKNVVHKLNLMFTYAWAVNFRNNGVKMFKQYPRFAHQYFALACKFLISYKPFENVSTRDGVSGSAMQVVLTQNQTNLAASLLKEHRYEDVLYATNFVEDRKNVTEKSIFRRATALYHLKEFEKARELIERVPNYYYQKDFAKLHQRVSESWRTSNEEYKTLVQRMFN